MCQGLTLSVSAALPAHYLCRSSSHQDSFVKWLLPVNGIPQIIINHPNVVLLHDLCY